MFTSVPVDPALNIKMRNLHQIAFFYSTSAHIVHQQSDEILFIHFVTMLNATVESKLSHEDKGYESGSENFNIPTPL